MNRFLSGALLLSFCSLFAGCDGGIDSMLSPKATPTPVPRPAATPKPGAWMWDKNRSNPLHQTPGPR